MFREIAKTIRLAVLNLGYHNTYHELATRTEWEGKQVPMFYNGNGDLEPLMTLDEGGMGYTRKAGKIAIRELEREETYTSCITEKFIMEMNIPLRIFSSIPREDFSCDDAFTDDEHAAEIMKALAGDPAGLALEIQAREARFIPTGTTTNSEQVWAEEVPGSEYKPLKTLSLVAVDLNARIKIDKDCLVAACNYTT